MSDDAGTVFALTCEVARLQSKVNELHRRAQAAEGHAAKAWRQNDTERLWRTVAELRWRTERYREKMLRWKRLYDANAARIRDSGLVSDVRWTAPYGQCVEGRLDVLVEKLIEAAKPSVWQRIVRWAAPSNGTPDQEGTKR